MIYVLIPQNSVTNDMVRESISSFNSNKLVKEEAIRRKIATLRRIDHNKKGSFFVVPFNKTFPNTTGGFEKFVHSELKEELSLPDWKHNDDMFKEKGVGILQKYLAKRRYKKQIKNIKPRI